MDDAPGRPLSTGIQSYPCRSGRFYGAVQNAELACEVTLQPLRRYKLDAAILFSDILTIPDAMGLGLYFEAGEGPRFTSPITSKADVDKLPILTRKMGWGT